MNFLANITLPSAIAVVLLRVVKTLVVIGCLTTQWYCAQQILNAHTAYSAYVGGLENFAKATAKVTAKEPFNIAHDGGPTDRYIQLSYAYEMLGRKAVSNCISFLKCGGVKPEEFSVRLGLDITQIAIH
jgi:hypothetical protein